MKQVKFALMVLALLMSLIIAGCGSSRALCSNKKCIESYEDTSQIYDYIGNNAPPKCVASSKQ